MWLLFMRNYVSMSRSRALHFKFAQGHPPATALSEWVVVVESKLTGQSKLTGTGLKSYRVSTALKNSTCLFSFGGCPTNNDPPYASPYFVSI